MSGGAGGWAVTEPGAVVVQEPCHASVDGGASKMVLLAWQGLVRLAKRSDAPRSMSGCDALRDASDRGAIQLNAFARGAYPGTAMPEEVLPGRYMLNKNVSLSD